MPLLSEVGIVMEGWVWYLGDLDIPLLHTLNLWSMRLNKIMSEITFISNNQHSSSNNHCALSPPLLTLADEPTDLSLDPRLTTPEKWPLLRTEDRNSP